MVYCSLVSAESHIIIISPSLVQTVGTSTWLVYWCLLRVESTLWWKDMGRLLPPMPSIKKIIVIEGIAPAHRFLLVLHSTSLRHEPQDVHIYSLRALRLKSPTITTNSLEKSDQSQASMLHGEQE